MPDNRFLPRILTLYFSVVYIVILGIVGSFMNTLGWVEAYALIFAIMAALSYALLYLLPALILTTGLHLR